MTIRTFEEMRAHVAGRPPVAVAVAGGDEPNVMASIVAALEGGLIASAAISGNPQAILANVPDALRERIRTLPADTPAAAAAAAVAEVHAGRAGLLIRAGSIPPATCARCWTTHPAFAAKAFCRT